MASRIGSFLVLVLVSACAFAQESDRTRTSLGEVALSNDTLELRYTTGGGEVGMDRSTRVSGAFFLSEERDIVLSAALMFPGVELLDRRLALMFGPQAYAALLDEENNDVLSLTVGVQARFMIDRGSGLAIAGKAFYGPDILTFGTADNLTDLSARIEMQVAPRVLAFGGMRWFELDLTEGDGEQTLMEEVFVGIGYGF